MTKQHFMALAAFAYDTNLNYEQVTRLAETLASFNPRFDMDRFMGKALDG